MERTIMNKVMSDKKVRVKNSEQQIVDKQKVIKIGKIS